jgi:phosphoglycolate phosphatase
VFAKQILDHFNLTPFFDAVYGSELNGHLSDKGELVAHILDAEHLDAKVTLIVGDRSHDIIGGKKNGIMTVAVSYGYGTREELTSSKPDFIFNTLSDLIAFIQSETTPNIGFQWMANSGALKKT